MSQRLPDTLLNRPLLPGFDETIIPSGQRNDSEEVMHARGSILQLKKIVSTLAKLSSAVDLREYAPGGAKPYAEGSGRDKHNLRSGISSAWETHETFEPGSSEPEPTRLNNTDESSI